jgi:RHS repeat-associated protein
VGAHARITNYASEEGVDISSVTTNATPSRSFTYDNAGNILTDAKGGVTTTYTYNNAGRMASLTVGSVGQGPYRYNGFGQLASRTITANPTRTIHMVYDQDGNLIFEADGATGEMLREYVWLQGRPVAVIDAAADSSIYAVHVDHLDRPVMMTNYAGAIVWQASYLPFGEVRTSSGPASLNYRLPGQWFVLETGLHYNWHRWYDALLGRYTQPDPIGMPDGPSRYAYARNDPLRSIDPEGLSVDQGEAISVPRLDFPILLLTSPATQCTSGQASPPITVLAARSSRRRSPTLFCQNVLCGAPNAGVVYPLCWDCNQKLKGGGPPILLENGRIIRTPIVPGE